MSDPVFVAIIVGVQGCFVAGVNAWIAARNHSENRAAIVDVDRKVEGTP